ncbi:MAG: fimbria major subunit [Tannerellaceae bacterium]|nr:fimbria major subunit [Tannerellaceae bacterium]
MRITKFVTFAIACVVLFSACNKDEFDGVEIPSIGVGEGSISLVLTDSTVPASVRSEELEDGGEAGESDIHVVEFYVFNGSTPDLTTPYKKYTTTDGRFTFDVDAASNKTVLAAINMNLGEISGSLEDVKKEIYKQPINSPVGISNNIPMTGEYTDLTVSSGDVETIVLEVSRLYARFNAPDASAARMNIKKQSELDSLAILLPNVPVNQIKFNMTGHVVINGLKKSFAFPNYGTAEANRWDSDVWTIGNTLENYTKSDYDNNGNLGTVYSGGIFLKNNESVYLYENCPVYFSSSETGTTSGYYASSVYSFIIEGELFDAENPNNKVTRYWRINVSKTGDQETIFKILRNAIYNINIKDVRTVGYATPEEAEDDDEDNGGGVIPGVNDAAIEVDVKVLSWRVFHEDSDI